MPIASQFNDRHLRQDGRYGEWMAGLATLPPVEPGWCVQGGVVHVGQALDDQRALLALLQQLIPWRKGPWCIAGVSVDTEWRSDFKWDRIAGLLDWSDRRVLDVGAGNGYFGWQMLEAGAASVVACDPTTLFVIQQQLISQLAGDSRNTLWACRLEELPQSFEDFDVVLSMGVLSHRRYREGHNMAHLGLLYRRLAPGGHLLLETLIVPDEAGEMVGDDRVLLVAERYARMRNVYALPTQKTLLDWLERLGFADATIQHVSETTIEEQRSTDWMPYQSLAEGLSLTDPNQTIEGYPRPTRAVVLAQRRS